MAEDEDEKEEGRRRRGREGRGCRRCREGRGRGQERVRGRGYVSGVGRNSAEGGQGQKKIGKLVNGWRQKRPLGQPVGRPAS